MHIEISIKQFKFLMELVHLGNWVVNSRKDPDYIDQRYEEITSIIYSYGKEAGCEKYVAYSKHSQSWVGTDYLYRESDSAKFLEEYDDHNFWSLLVEHFAFKDFYNKYTAEKINKMSSQERFEKIYDLIQTYKDETYDHNIDCFEFVRRIPKEK